MQPPSDNIWVGELPVSITQSQLLETFGQYGIVTSARILPPIADGMRACALIRYATIEHAQWVVNRLNGNIPQGLEEPISCRFASYAGQNYQQWSSKAAQAKKEQQWASKAAPPKQGCQDPGHGSKDFHWAPKGVPATCSWQDNGHQNGRREHQWPSHGEKTQEFGWKEEPYVSKSDETRDAEAHICECGNRIVLDSAFCSNCGKKATKHQAVEICECGNKILPEAAFCRKCGKKSAHYQAVEICECGNRILPGSAFCSKCGKKTRDHQSVEICECGTRIMPDSNFCSNCGKKCIHRQAVEICECGNQIMPEAAFCSKCGKKSTNDQAVEICECGSRIMPGSAFCGKCGKQSLRPQAVETCECGNQFKPEASFCAKCGKKRVQSETPYCNVLWMNSEDAGKGADRYTPYEDVSTRRKSLIGSIIPKGKHKGKFKGPSDFESLYKEVKRCGIYGQISESVPHECTVYANNLPPDTTDLELFKLFSPFGAIAPTGVRAMRHDDGTCKGMGFVHFVEPLAAQVAVDSLADFTLPDGAFIKVSQKVHKD